jgi:hypothetical protein
LRIRTLRRRIRRGADTQTDEKRNRRFPYENRGKHGVRRRIDMPIPNDTRKRRQDCRPTRSESEKQIS